METFKGNWGLESDQGGMEQHVYPGIHQKNKTIQPKVESNQTKIDKKKYKIKERKTRKSHPNLQKWKTKMVRMNIETIEVLKKLRKTKRESLQDVILRLIKAPDAERESYERIISKYGSLLDEDNELYLDPEE
jgi:hypothetical protein